MSSFRFLNIILFSILLPVTAYSQDNADGSKIELLRNFHTQMNSASIETSVDFLNLFKEKSTSVEYLEYRNEILYELLDKQPLLYLQAMCLISDEQWNPIMNEIESPVHETDFNLGILEVPIPDDDCRFRVFTRTLASLDKAVVKSFK